MCSVPHGRFSLSLSLPLSLPLPLSLSSSIYPTHMQQVCSVCCCGSDLRIYCWRTGCNQWKWIVAPLSAFSVLTLTSAPPSLSTSLSPLSHPSTLTPFSASVPIPLMPHPFCHFHFQSLLTIILSVFSFFSLFMLVPFFLGGAALLLVLLVVEHAFRFLTLAIGIVYPAYMSFKAIESSTKEDDTQWLTYWVVFASFSVLEIFTGQCPCAANRLLLFPPWPAAFSLAGDCLLLATMSCFFPLSSARLYLVGLPLLLPGQARLPYRVHVP